MPFVSKSQMRWAYANKPQMAAKWQEHTPDNAKLPEHARKSESYERAIKRMEK